MLELWSLIRSSRAASASSVIQDGQTVTVTVVVRGPAGGVGMDISRTRLPFSIAEGLYWKLPQQSAWAVAREPWPSLVSFFGLCMGLVS